jgi:hypothetical protein
LYRTDCGTVPTMVLGAVSSHVPAWPAAGHSFMFKCRAVGWGENYMFMFNCALMTHQKATPDSLRTLS